MPVALVNDHLVTSLVINKLNTNYWCFEKFPIMSDLIIRQLRSLRFHKSENVLTASLKFRGCNNGIIRRKMSVFSSQPMRSHNNNECKKLICSSTFILISDENFRPFTVDSGSSESRSEAPSRRQPHRVVLTG